MKIIYLIKMWAEGILLPRFAYSSKEAAEEYVEHHRGHEIEEIELYEDGYVGVDLAISERKYETNRT